MFKESESWREEAEGEADGGLTGAESRIMEVIPNGTEERVFPSIHLNIYPIYPIQPQHTQNTYVHMHHA